MGQFPMESAFSESVFGVQTDTAEDLSVRPRQGPVDHRAKRMVRVRKETTTVRDLRRLTRETSPGRRRTAPSASPITSESVLPYVNRPDLLETSRQ